jgi:hypothetical protein
MLSTFGRIVQSSVGLTFRSLWMYAEEIIEGGIDGH